jgi:hypothetical protein
LKTVNISPSYIYGVILKIISCIITTILLFSYCSAANKSITEVGSVEIEDLFYNSESPLSPAEIEKIEPNKVDKILDQNEDFELENLEIDDIDLTTFGEYEDFLNRYYDDNFIDINSRFIRQIEFNLTTSFGGRIPFGANAKSSLNTGLDLGITLSPINTFKILNFDSKLFSNINYSLLTPQTQLSHYQNLSITRITGGITTYLNTNIFSSMGISLTSSTGGDLQNSIRSYGGSINIDLGFKFNVIRNINIGFYTRAQMMVFGVPDPPIDGGGSLETLSIGMIFDAPIYLVY